MKCCGKDCLTPFCPFCGKGTADDAAVTLLTHLRSVAKAAKGHLEAWKDMDKRNGEPEREHPKMEAKVEKWEAWCDLVEGWMRQDQKSQS